MTKTTVAVALLTACGRALIASEPEISDRSPDKKYALWQQHADKQPYLGDVKLIESKTHLGAVLVGHEQAITFRDVDLADLKSGLHEAAAALAQQFQRSVGFNRFDSFPGLAFLREVAAEIGLPAFAGSRWEQCRNGRCNGLLPSLQSWGPSFHESSLARKKSLPAAACQQPRGLVPLGV